MADGYIWVSNVLNDSSLVVGTDVDSEESARKSIFKREYPANKDLPARLYAHYKDEAFDKGLPELFTGGGGTKISPKLADIFRQFNLGSGRTCPLKLYLHDRKTPVDLEIFLLYWWEQRQFLDLEKSIGLRGRRPSRVQPNPPPPLSRVAPSRALRLPCFVARGAAVPRATRSTARCASWSVRLRAGSMLYWGMCLSRSGLTAWSRWESQLL